MTDSKSCSDRMLHAYVDGELSTGEKQSMLSRFESDPQCRQRVCDLQRTKEWVQFSFEDVRAPTRELPASCDVSRLSGVIRVAASVLVLVCVFGAGWYGHSLREEYIDHALLQDQPAPDSKHVILHIGESDEALFASLLKKTERILDQYSARGVRVEVVANAGGLDLMRTAASRHIENIKQLIAHYPNVRFIACSKGLKRLQEMGQDARVIEGVQSDGPAADHLVQRLTQGWTLIRL